MNEVLIHLLTLRTAQMISVQEVSPLWQQEQATIPCKVTSLPSLQKDPEWVCFPLGIALASMCTEDDFTAAFRLDPCLGTA